MKKVPALKKRSFFNPDSIATAVSQALVRDLDSSAHEYELDKDSPLPLLVAQSRQTNELLKKYVSPQLDTSGLEELTYRKFLETNVHMSNYNDLDFPDQGRFICRTMPHLHKVLLRARALVHNVLTDFSEDEWFQNCKHSSGSSIGVPYQDTSIERKFTFPVTATERVKPMLYRYLEYDFHMKGAIKEFNSRNPISDPIEIVQGSRATTVDKTSSIRRMICVEPTGNMFLQQGLMHMMYIRLKKFGLDVETLPDTHRELARISSITGKNATIDWSSASDCVSIGLLR